MAVTPGELPSEHRVFFFSFFFYICLYVHTHVPLGMSCHLCSGALGSLKIVSDILEMELGSANTDMGSESQLRASVRAASILNHSSPAQVLIYESGYDFFFKLHFVKSLKSQQCRLSLLLLRLTTQDNSGLSCSSNPKRYLAGK